MKKYFQKWFTEQHRVGYWDSIYDEPNFFGELFRQRMNTSLSWLNNMGLHKNAKILDVGCGAGRPAREFVKKEYNVFGMDYSFGMLQKANILLNADNQRFVSLSQGDIEYLPFQSSSFDAVLALGVIAYLHSEERALSELNRVLKPGGILILSFINKARIVRHLDFPFLLKNTSQKIFNNRPTSRKNGNHNHTPRMQTYLIPQLRTSMKASGFTVSAYETVPLELLTFMDRELYPREMAEKVTLFFEKFSNIPVIESVGGMCVMKAIKK